MKKTWKRILSVALTVLMVAGMAMPAFAADNNGGWRSASFEKVENGAKLPLKNSEVEEEPAQYADNDTVRVSIVLDGASTTRKFTANSVAQSRAAKNYRAALKARQDNVAKRISGLALGGEKLDVVWNLTLAANIISANVKYGQIESIKHVPGVADVVLETRYEPQETETAAEPQMTTATEMTGTNFAWAAGLTGAGGKVAIIDTGVDTDHISFDGDAFDYAISTLDKEVDLLTVEDIDGVLADLNAAQRSAGVTAEDLYVSSKIPFAYNYVDKNLDATNANDTEGEHGSHVAGTAAANRYIADGEGGFVDAAETVKVVGQAPDAQIFAMKVFGKGGGAYDSDYFAAVEDSILLGADATNLSLGSAVAGFTYNDTYQTLLDSLVDSNLVNANSAGNNGSWADNTQMGYLYGEDKNLATGGSPGTYTNTLSTASVDNFGFTGATLKFAGESIFYTEGTDYGNVALDTLTGDYEFIAIDGFGTEEEFAALADVLEGKVAICSRGQTSFFEKANAAISNGAVATIIYNNQPGTINMNLTGYVYNAPAVSITQADGEFIKSNANAVTDEGTGEVLYYTGTIGMPSGIETNRPEADFYTMSDFTSWGVPGNLSLKPEITAPGGNIYSVNGLHQTENGTPSGSHTAYENMSGTSMAAPQITGITAILAEYIRDNDLIEKTGLSKRALTQALIMGTATPLIEEDSGNFYSVMRQGAGLVDVEAAVNTNTVLTMHEDATASAKDGKIKAELGVVSRDEKAFNFTFDVTNFGDTEMVYDLDADFFTQDYFAYYENDAEGVPKIDGEGAPVVSYYMDTWTADLAADVVWTVDGEVYESENALKYDFNADGVASYSDVQTLLEFIAGNVESVNDQEYADIDGDEDIDTYDAYLALDAIKQANVTVPAGEKVTVNIAVSLEDIDDYDLNGAYVEGYVYVTEQDSEDGAIGVTNSIPVIGFYGDWSEPTMFDHGSYIDNDFGTEDHTPYMAASDLGAKANTVKAFFINYTGVGTYVASGNPYVYDDEYVEARNAIKPNDSIFGVRYSQIRNSDAGRITVTDGEGNDLFVKELAPSYAAYYNENQGVWQSTSTQQTIGYKPAELEDGTVITATIQLAPEYYTAGETIDWGALADGTRYSQQFTVDGTAPDLYSVDVHYDTKKGGFDAIQVVAGDNRYIAAIMLLDEEGEAIAYLGSDPDVEAAAGEYYSYLFDLTKYYEDLTEVPDHMEIVVGDYATNESTYKINLNPDELHEDISVELDTEELVIVKGNSRKVVAAVSPWGTVNENVIWSSDNEEIATVDESGVITGVAPGTAKITATAEADPDASATVNVTVKEIIKDYDGVVWDENGDVWFAGFNTSTIPAYDKKVEESINLPIASLTYDENGTLYGASFDSDAWTSNLYTIDEDTFEATLIGSSSIGYMDLAPAPALSDAADANYLVAAYGTYILIVNKDTGEYESAFNMSSFTGGNYIVGVAYQESFMNTYYNIPVDWFFFVDEAGELYDTGFIAINGNFSRFSVYDDGQVGDAVDTPYFQSLYCDTDGNLVWSRFDEGEDDVDIIYGELSVEGDVFELGSFEKSVWPVGGLYEEGDAPVFNYAEMISGESIGDHVAEVAEVQAVSEVEKLNPAPAAGGTLNAAIVSEKAVQHRKINVNAVSFDITADAAATNGLYTVEYDPTVYDLLGVESNAKYYAVNLTDGKLTIAFVDADKFAEGDVVATVNLYTIADGDKTVVITTDELNSDNDLGIVETLFVTTEPIYGAPTWTWAYDNTSAIATFVDNSGKETKVEAVVNSESTDATYTKEGKIVYTATVEFNGEVYTDTVTVTTDALELPFVDVPKTAWFYNAVIWALENDYTAGLDETHFGPNAEITRAEVVQFLYAVAGKPEVEANDTFTDVAADAWYADAVAWAVENGITAGTTETTFSPDAVCTREQIVCFLYAAAGKPEVESTQTDFTDVPADAWFAKSVAWAVENNVTYGVGANLFGTGNVCTRAQLVTFLFAANG